MLKYFLISICFFASGYLRAQSYDEEPPYADTFSTGEEAEAEEVKTYAPEPGLLVPVSLPMEKTKRGITDKQWQNMTSDPAFNYDDPEHKEVIDKNPGIWAAIILAIAEFFTSGAGMILLWIIVGAALIFIVLRIIKMKGNLFFAKNDKKVAEESDEYADEYIPEDWNQAITEAAGSGNYRLAVRHAYRYLLLILSEDGKINYQVAKTNYQYAYELNGTALYQPFLFMTREYEYVWYGGFELQEQQFKHYYSLLKKIQSGLA